MAHSSEASTAGVGYVQIAAALRSRLRSGEFPVGARIPAGRQLADEYGVAPNTVASAIRLLRDEGLITSQQGRGNFVRTLPSETGEDSADFTAVMCKLDRLQESLRAVNARLDDLEDEVRGKRKDRQPAT
ncbi:GntR family transcriptional regulator [Spinactinospora alkalitolerans]|uniref:GntR family transcriptional regulator n=1 Tax=Spinactinospora alkalitolerans TaxID=687207 RepID=UPI001C546441